MCSHLRTVRGWGLLSSHGHVLVRGLGSIARLLLGLLGLSSGSLFLGFLGLSSSCLLARLRLRRRLGLRGQLALLLRRDALLELLKTCDGPFAEKVQLLLFLVARLCCRLELGFELAHVLLSLFQGRSSLLLALLGLQQLVGAVLLLALGPLERSVGGCQLHSAGLALRPPGLQEAAQFFDLCLKALVQLVHDGAVEAATVAGLLREDALLCSLQ
mmetsp:Transcript_15979/g.30073  ORF Transcript_15979/g.30073 Transcript_15979/m.30073 type:complete len:215 (+) Transcript_15979:195-839(+)